MIKENILQLLTRSAFGRRVSNRHPDLQETLNQFVEDIEFYYTLDKALRPYIVTKFKLSDNAPFSEINQTKKRIIKRDNNLYVATDLTFFKREIKNHIYNANTDSAKRVSELALGKAIFDAAAGLATSHIYHLLNARSKLLFSRDLTYERHVNRLIKIMQDNDIRSSIYYERVKQYALLNSISNTYHHFMYGNADKVQVGNTTLALGTMHNMNNRRGFEDYDFAFYTDIGYRGNIAASSRFDYVLLPNQRNVMERSYNSATFEFSRQWLDDSFGMIQINPEALIDNPAGYLKLDSYIPQRYRLQILDQIEQYPMHLLDFALSNEFLLSGDTIPEEEFNAFTNGNYDTDRLVNLISEALRNGNYEVTNTRRIENIGNINPRELILNIEQLQEEQSTQRRQRRTRNRTVRQENQSSINADNTDITSNRRPVNENGLVGLLLTQQRTDEDIREPIQERIRELRILSQVDYDNLELKKPAGGGHNEGRNIVITSQQGLDALEKLTQEAELISKSKLIKEQGFNVNNFRGLDSFVADDINSMSDEQKRDILPFAGYINGNSVMFDNLYAMHRYGAESGLGNRFWRTSIPRQDIRKKILNNNDGLIQNIKGFNINSNNITVVNMPEMSVRDLENNGLIIPVERDKVIYVPPFVDLSYTYGLEFELQTDLSVSSANEVVRRKIREMFDIDLKDLSLDGKDYQAVRDPSVHNGHEIVTGVYSGITGLKAIYYLTEALKALGYKAGINPRGDTNGLHINIGSIEENLRKEAVKFAVDYLRLTEEVYKRAFISSLRYNSDFFPFRAAGLTTGIPGMSDQEWKHFWFAGLSKFRKLQNGRKEYDYLRQHGEYPFDVRDILTDSGFSHKKVAKYKFMSLHKLLLFGIGEFRIFDGSLRPDFYFNQMFIALKIFDDIRNGTMNSVKLPYTDKLIPPEEGWTNKNAFKSVMKTVMNIDDNIAEYLYKFHKKCKSATTIRKLR